MNRNLMGTPLWDPPSRCGSERTPPRGWIVAVRKKGADGPWRIAYDGAVFCNKAMAGRKAGILRSLKIMRDWNVLVLPEGLVR